MEFTKYKYVLAVAEMRSISKAAVRCALSQPALTRSINRMEGELGVKLFDRSTLPLRLTYAGERYIAGIKNMLAMKYQLDAEMEEIAGLKKGRLIVGIPSSFSSVWLPQILPPFLQKYPGIEVQIIEGLSQDLEESLVKEEIDIIIASPLPITQASIEYEEIVTEQLLLVFSRADPLFKGLAEDNSDNLLHFIDASLLDGASYISTTPKQGLNRIAKQMFDSFGVKPNVVVETANPSTAMYLASSGLGFAVTTVSNFLHKQFDVKPLFCTLYDPPVERALVAAYKKDRPLQASARHFIDTVKYHAINSPVLNVPKFSVAYDVDQIKNI